jgi:hypothetical protein
MFWVQDSSLELPAYGDLGGGLFMLVEDQRAGYIFAISRAAFQHREVPVTICYLVILRHLQRVHANRV